MENKEGESSLSDGVFKQPGQGRGGGSWGEGGGCRERENEHMLLHLLCFSAVLYFWLE